MYFFVYISTGERSSTNIIIVAIAVPVVLAAIVIVSIIIIVSVILLFKKYRIERKTKLITI